MKGQWGKLAVYIVGTGATAAALTIIPPLLGGGSGWMPDLISSEGAAIDKLFWGLVWLSIIIFALVCGIVAYSIVHFRAQPNDTEDGEYIHGNTKMEAVWIIVPSIIVFVIGIISYVILRDNEVGLYDKASAKDAGAASMVVDVRGYSFGWAFRYETTDGKPLSKQADMQSVSELVLPVDKVVRFNVISCSGKEALGRIQKQVERRLASGDHENRFADIEPGICEREWDLTSKTDRKAQEKMAEDLYHIKQLRQDGKPLSVQQKAVWEKQPLFRGDQQFIDVNHAFWVPEARLKVDAVAGLRTYVQWKASRVTTPKDHYQVVCAELCGSGHNAMRTNVCVVDQSTFDWWLGLDNEARASVSCVKLRLLSCLGENIDDRKKVLTAITKLVEDNDEAGCADAKEMI